MQTPTAHTDARRRAAPSQAPRPPPPAPASARSPFATALSPSKPPLYGRRPFAPAAPAAGPLLSSWGTGPPGAGEWGAPRHSGRKPRDHGDLLAWPEP